MPLQARHWAYSATAIGLGTAGVYAGLVVGTLVTTRLLQRVPANRLIVFATVASAVLLLPSLLDDGRWTLFPARTAAWLCLGTAVATSKVIGTTESDPTARAALLIRLASAGAVGSILGGLASGWVLDHGGTRGLTAAMTLGLFLAAALFSRIPPVAATSARAAASGVQPDPRFVALIGAGVAGSLGRLLLPLAMDGLGHSGAEVSMAASVGALATLPLAAGLAGLRSDGHRLIAAVACACAVGMGVALTGTATKWWVFVAGTAAISTYNYAGSDVVMLLATQGAPSAAARDARTVALSPRSTPFGIGSGVICPWGPST